MGLSWFGVHAFDLATETIRPFWIQFDMDRVAFAYFAAVSLLSGIVFGLVPALRASRVNLNSTLKDGAPSVAGFRGGRLTGSLVVLQFALTVVLLSGAGMMMRSFATAQSMNRFVPAESILTARVDLPAQEGNRYSDPASRQRFMDELLTKLAALPGMAEAAAGSYLPGMGAGIRSIEIEASPNETQDQTPKASFLVQTPGYLPAIQLPVIQGRGLEERDGELGNESAVVTREFAAAHWPNESAIGQRLRFIQNDKPKEWMTVVGVCGDIVQNPREPAAPPLIYIPYRQDPGGYMYLILRARGDTAAIAGVVGETAQSLDPDLPLFDLSTLPAAFNRSNWTLRVFGVLFSVFALIGLLMASVGIYAVVAQGAAPPHP